jgi:tetratricopeptide (TPR) repeat protein
MKPFARFNLVSARSRLFWLLPALMLFVAPFAARAADAAGGFEVANKLYEEGKFSDALTAYDQILKSGASEAVLFNRGNALFKLGELGRAIESYRVAQQLAPRDHELRSNLDFVRTRARGGAPFHTPRWQTWLGSLSLNEWAFLTAVAFWILFLLLALVQWRRELRPRLLKPMLATGAAFLLLAVGLGIELNTIYYAPSAIVVTGETDVRNGPFDEAPSVYKVRDGAELTVVDQKDNWLQVADSAQRLGWVRRDQVLVFSLTAPSWTKS